MIRLVRNLRSTDPVIVNLRRQLDRFYASATEYSAFQSTELRDPFYSLITPFLRELISSGSDRPRVLELGAGRTGFPDYLGRAGVPVHFTAQDVTNTNRDYLSQYCDAVHIGDIKDLGGEYDLILSTFVFEHVSAPREFLEQVKRLLSRRGAHVIACPRYDLPGYICPSMRHLPRSQQVLQCMALTGSRLL